MGTILLMLVGLGTTRLPPGFINTYCAESDLYE